MLAGLAGDRRVIGAIVVGNRVGVGGSFDGQDLKLFGTLSRHLGAALGHDRLERRVSELREMQEHLYHQAFHDPLTGLANRMLFMDRAAHAVSRRRGTQRSSTSTSTTSSRSTTRSATRPATRCWA
jgi:GAF domain-containing protein